MKKMLLTAVAGLLLLSLCVGCGRQAEPEKPVITAVVTASPAPSPTATPESTAVPSAPASLMPTLPPGEDMRETVTGGVGTYTYAMSDGSWTLDLRENGTYTLLETRGLGSAASTTPHTGESWVVNEDGSVTCSPTDIWAADFSFSDGCSEWIIYADGTCSPVLGIG